MNRQKQVLALLVGVLILALGYAIWAMPRQTPASGASLRSPATPRPEAAGKGSAPADELRVHLELMVRENEAPPGFKRNIFGFWQPASKPLPASLPVSLPPPPPPPAGAGDQTPVLEEVRKELARFTFLGYLLKDGVKTIFLSASEEIFVVTKGDRFGHNKRFLVAELTPERLTIRQNDDPRPITIPLVEQAPLAEAHVLPPGPEFPSRPGPTRPRRLPLAVPTSEDLRPVEPVESAPAGEPLDPAAPGAPVDPALPVAPTDPAPPSAPVAPTERAEPVQVPVYEAAPLKMLPLEP
jgi:hypothetical protein